MLELKYTREHLEEVKEKIGAGANRRLERFAKLDARRRNNPGSESFGEEESEFRLDRRGEEESWMPAERRSPR